MDATPQLVREFLTDEMDTKSASTACHSYLALSAFLGFLVNDEFLTDSVTKGVEKPKRRRTVIDTFSLEQLEALVSKCGGSFTGARDMAIKMFMFDSGLRVSELCGLSLDDIDWTDQTVVVLGKRNRERAVSFGTLTRYAITDYLARHGQLVVKNLFVTYYGEPVDRYRAGVSSGNGV